MTTKLTLSIDDAVISGAKKYAKYTGRSLSGIVENYLKTLVSSPPEDEQISPRILKLMGAIQLPEDFDYKKALQEDLMERHRV